MSKASNDEAPNLGLTNAQFDKLAEILQIYIKVRALGSIDSSTKSKVERSIWILDAAKYGQREIAKILHVSTHTVRAVLRGKKLKEGEAEIGE